MRREIESRTGRDAAIGAVYATLERLEAKHLVASRDEKGTPERGMRVKRIYTVTAAGQRAAAKTQKAVAQMMQVLRLHTE